MCNWCFVFKQACDITGGLYLKVPQKIALAQYLLVRFHVFQAKFVSFFMLCHILKVRVLCQWVFLPDADQRSQLLLPPPVHVDYRAACFCHRNLIEIGYVCSVCLSSMYILPTETQKYIFNIIIKCF